MPKLTVNGLDIAYEDHGSKDGPVVLYIHGLGTPLTGWPRSYWEPMVAAGCRVLLMDNRDVGQSSPVKGARIPSMKDIVVSSLFRKRMTASYTLDDMSDDAIGLLDGLNIRKAHVIGASMGGMIGQIMAIHHPQRVATLTAIMTTTGARHLPGPTLSVRWRLIQKPKERTRDALVRHGMKTWKVIGSPEYPTPDEHLYDYVHGIHKRGVSSRGYLRHMAAIMASGDRTYQVRELAVPSLVIHGSSDPLVPVECGRHLAAQIPGARLHEIPGMGHDFPEQLAGPISNLILHHTQEVYEPFLLSKIR